MVLSLSEQKIGLVLDVETTGIDPKSAEIIEVGLLQFSWEPDAKTCRFLESVSFLRQPSHVIPANITKITGIDDAMVAGRKMDWKRVQKLIDSSDVLIAHNMEFDRGFLSASGSLDLEDCHWACSIAHIDWRAKGFGSRALNYLAADHGFVNPFAHRALFDCATTFRLVSQYFPELYKRSLEKEYWIHATGAAFEKKDLLKNNHYRWDRERRVWKKRTVESELAGERKFLEEQVYAGPPGHLEEEISKA
jgi:DNA polymerase-3 subunit epsilon